MLGVNERTGHHWFSKAGGVPPLSLVEPVKTRTLNIAEREKILAGINQDLSIRADRCQHPAGSLDGQP